MMRFVVELDLNPRLCLASGTMDRSCHFLDRSHCVLFDRGLTAEHRLDGVYSRAYYRCGACLQCERKDNE